MCNAKSAVLVLQKVELCSKGKYRLIVTIKICNIFQFRKSLVWQERKHLSCKVVSKMLQNNKKEHLIKLH